METENFGQRAKRKTISFMKKFLVISLILVIAVFSFMYWATYESGVMARQMQKNYNIFAADNADKIKKKNQRNLHLSAAKYGF